MSRVRNQIDLQSISTHELDRLPPIAGHRSLPIENNTRYRRNNRPRVGGSSLQVSEPARSENVLRVDIEAGRFHTVKELTDFVRELDRRMRESDEVAILEDATPQQQHALCKLELTNTQIER